MKNPTLHISSSEHIYYVLSIPILLTLCFSQRNQKHIVENSIRALRPLIGFDWGQHGDVVFFIQGAFRDDNKRVSTFK
jgi:hypothetical protein